VPNYVEETGQDHSGIFNPHSSTLDSAQLFFKDALSQAKRIVSRDFHPFPKVQRMEFNFLSVHSEGKVLTQF
jgi:hypothetical protein